MQMYAYAARVSPSKASIVRCDFFLFVCGMFSYFIRIVQISSFIPEFFTVISNL